MDRTIILFTSDHGEMNGSEQDDSPVPFSSGFNFLENLSDLIVDQGDFSCVTGAQLSRIADPAWRFSELLIQFSLGAMISNSRSLDRFRHILRAVDAGVRLGCVPRFVRSGETDPAEPRLRPFVIVKVIFRLLTDINIVI